MTDPFSIVAGTLGILEICVHVTRYLHKIKSSAKDIENSLTSLIEETQSLRNVNNLIQKLWIEHNDEHNEANGSNPLVADYWKAVNSSLESCKVSITALESKVDEIVGHNGRATKNKLDGIKKTLRKESKEAQLQDIRTELTGYRYSLQMLLQVLTFSYSQSSQAAIGRDLHNLSDKVVSQGFEIQRQIKTLLSRTEFMEHEQFRSSVAAASKAVSLVRLNKHFYPPRPVTSLYTGRRDLLERLKTIISTSPVLCQCRFVVCGLGGSGKTEFCCKFAQDNRNSFWGVFSVDGTSDRTIRHSFANIAKLAKLGEQLGEFADVAGKNWLANLELPWLLIIDNADTLSMNSLQKHFPAGERGVILITTRVRDLRLLGTTSPTYFDFGQDILSETDSNELLLRAAEETKRTEDIWEAAKKIARRLGYLPLALIQAGRAILGNVSRCTLETYLDIYDHSWAYIRRKFNLDRSHASLSFDGIINMNVYSSFMISFRGLENTKTLPAQDAVDLLKLFSFFSNENIRFSILTTAVFHARRRREYDEEEIARKAQTEPNSWSSWLRTVYLWYLRQIDKSTPSLPSLLRDENYDKMRLGDALDQLLALALISYSGGDDSYSMHPLIHQWIREQPEMRNAEQALWCEIASSVLAQSILLPPLDTIESSEELKKHLLPHVDHVQRYREAVRVRLADNSKARRRPWRLLGPIFTRQLAWTYAKFSLIYYSNGQLDEAENLQLQVLEFIRGRLGEDNEAAWLVKLFLSQTYAMQTNFNKASELQEAVVNSSARMLGEDNVQTLKYMIILGDTRSFQTRLKESKQLLQTAISGLEKKLGPTADDVFVAKHSLGRTMRRYTNYEACNKLYTEAFDGLSKSEQYGPAHEKTWEAQEDLAMSMLDLENANIDFAYDLVHEVKKKRKDKFGTEHPLTLLSRCDLARVESARGHHVKAEKIIRKHLPVAERILGENHFGTLMGKTHLASILGRQKRYDEAEEIFKYVTDRKHYASSSREDGEHIDRLYALKLLLQMYISWGRPEAALEMCDQMEAGTGKIGGEKLGLEHPIIGWLASIRQEIILSQRAHDVTDVADGPSSQSSLDLLLDGRLRKRRTG